MKEIQIGFYKMPESTVVSDLATITAVGLGIDEIIHIGKQTRGNASLLSLLFGLKQLKRICYDNDQIIITSSDIILTNIIDKEVFSEEELKAFARSYRIFGEGSSEIIEDIMKLKMHFTNIKAKVIDKRYNIANKIAKQAFNINLSGEMEVGEEVNYKPQRGFVDCNTLETQWI